MLMMLLLAAGAPVASAAASPAPRAIVPAEIERHYRDYNLVNAFSTRGERTTIAGGRAPSEPRLQRIARAMRRITTEVHHWRRIDGTWRRDAATVHFLAS